jgi:hypothetical protein
LGSRAFARGVVTSAAARSSPPYSSWDHRGASTAPTQTETGRDCDEGRRNSSWVESTVSWGSAPAADAATLASLGSVVTGNWYEVDVTSAVTGDGLVSLRASSSSSNGTDYSSKEGAAGFAPQLVVTASSTPAETVCRRSR